MRFRKLLEYDDEKNFISYDIIQDMRLSINETRHISHEDRMFARNLKNVKLFMDNNKITFTNADKENANVSMNREDYQNSMLTMLCDNNSYEPLVSDPLSTLQKKTKDLLHSSLTEIKCIISCMK